MDNRDEEEIIYLLQENLSSVRRIAGWTTEELGGKIGVTKQTISNLENKKTIMTRVQYIAIGSVLKYEVFINKNSDSGVLAYVVGILLDSDKSYSDEEKGAIKKNIEMLAVASSGGMKGKNLEEFCEKLGKSTGIMAGIAGASLASGMSISMWLGWLGAILGMKTIKKDKKKKKE